MKLKLFSVILALFLAVQTVMAAPFNANAKTKRIPAGTKFQLQLLSPLSTLKKSGDDFSANSFGSKRTRFLCQLPFNISRQ